MRVWFPHLAPPSVAVSFSAVVLGKDDQGEHLQCQGLLCLFYVFFLLFSCWCGHSVVGIAVTGFISAGVC